MKSIRMTAALLAAVIMIMIMGTSAFAADDMLLKTTASVNLRKGPGLGYGTVTAVSKNIKYEYTGISSYDSRGVVWHQVEYKKGYAWVSSRYSDVYNDGWKLSDETFVRTTGNVNLRKGPGTGYGKLMTAAKGTKLFYLGESAKDGNGNTWYKVSCAWGEAWVISRYAVKTSETVNYEAYVKTTASVNLRKGPGTGYAKVTSYAKDKQLTYLGESSKDSRGVVWYKVSDGKNTGWVSSVYAKMYN